MGDGKGVEGAPLLMLPARVRTLLPTFFGMGTMDNVGEHV
jgi:hypothetical protein